MEQIKKNLAELDFSHNEIKIYLTLTTLGESTASQIAKKAEMPRTTAISLLEKLTQKGFFSKHVYKGTTYYWVEAPRVLEEVYANKVEAAHQLAGYLRNIYRTEHAFPFVEVYDTAKTIRNFIEKLLIGLKKNSVIYTIDSPNLGNYHKIFSDQYSEIFLGLKRKKNVLTKTLIPAGTFVSINPKKLKTQNILIKELPKSISFSASLWLINNFLVLFSGQPPFVVVVSHQVIVESCQKAYIGIYGKFLCQKIKLKKHPLGVFFIFLRGNA